VAMAYGDEYKLCSMSLPPDNTVPTHAVALASSINTLFARLLIPAPTA